MRNWRASVAALAIFSYLPAPAPASQLTPGEAPVITPQGVVATPEPSVTDALGRWQLLIRRSFSSRVQEQESATVTYETAGKGRNDYHIDAAAGRYFKSGNLNISPSVEWHRRSVSSVDRNRLSADLTGDWTIEAGSVTPLLRGQAEVGRDLVKGITTSTGSLLLSGFVPHGDLSGSSLTLHGSYKGTFYPYAGLEYFHNQPVGDLTSVSTTMALAMVETRLAPWNGSTKGIDSALEIDGSYAFRKPLNSAGNGALRNRYQLLKLALNVYLDTMHHVALGFEYQNGQDPDGHLVSGHAGLLALRFKL
jgi:hypothetical protein